MVQSGVAGVRCDAVLGKSHNPAFLLALILHGDVGHSSQGIARAWRQRSRVGLNRAHPDGAGRGNTGAPDGARFFALVFTGGKRGIVAYFCRQKAGVAWHLRLIGQGILAMRRRWGMCCAGHCRTAGSGFTRCGGQSVLRERRRNGRGFWRADVRLRGRFWGRVRVCV